MPITRPRARIAPPADQIGRRTIPHAPQRRHLPSRPEATRRAAFAALVAAQDGDASAADSRAAVAAEYGLTPEQVAAIEREGIARQCPPLGDGAEG